MTGRKLLKGKGRHPAAGGGGDITTGLIHFWPLTDGQVTGGLANDIGTPGGFNIGCAGGVTSVAGPNATFATARALDGTDGTRLDLGGAPPFNWNTGSFSIALWIWVNNNSVAGPTSGQQLFMSDTNSLGANFLRISNMAGIPGGLFFSTSGVDVRSTTTVFSAAWVHLVVTNSGGGSSGTKGASMNGSPLSLAAPVTSGDTTFANTIHAFGAGSDTDGKLAGKFSAIRMYNRVLSPLDVSTLYNGGAGG